MGAFIHAVQVFWAHLSAVRWQPLGIALGFHLLKLGVRGLAWRNILVAAYPGTRIGRGPVFGAYAAGIGVNAIAPARAGDVVKLYLVKRRIPGARYPTLAPTLVVETLLDLVVAGAIFLWALAAGALPSRYVLERIPNVDWSWLLLHPRATLAIASGLLVALLALSLYVRRRVRDLRAQVAYGFAILREPRRYLRLVASWQALSWVFRLASVWFFLRAFDLTATVGNVFKVQVMESLATLLPFTPGGAGTKQGLMAYVFRDEFSVTHVISFSVGMNIALTAVNVVLGFAALFLLARTLRWRRIAERERAEAGAPTA